MDCINLLVGVSVRLLDLLRELDRFCEKLLNRRGAGFMESAGEGAKRIYGEGSCEELLSRRWAGFMESAGESAERSYGEGTCEEQVNQK